MRRVIREAGTGWLFGELWGGQCCIFIENSGSTCMGLTGVSQNQDPPSNPSRNPIRLIPGEHGLCPGH